MAQLVEAKEGEDGNIEKTEWCEVGFVQRRKCELKVFIYSCRSNASQPSLTLAMKEQTELDCSVMTADF